MAKALRWAAIIVIACVGCGPKVASKPIGSDERLKKLESRMKQARDALASKAMPDFEDLGKTATQTANSYRGSPQEATAKNLSIKVMEMEKKANARGSVDDVRKIFEEVDKLFGELKAAAPAK